MIKINNMRPLWGREKGDACLWQARCDPSGVRRWGIDLKSGWGGIQLKSVDGRLIGSQEGIGFNKSQEMED